MTITNRHGEKITASKEVLNYLSLALEDSAERQAEKGHECLQRTYKEWASLIYQSLKECGYYE